MSGTPRGGPATRSVTRGRSWLGRTRVDDLGRVDRARDQLVVEQVFVPCRDGSAIDRVAEELRVVIDHQAERLLALLRRYHRCVDELADLLDQLGAVGGILNPRERVD